MSRAAQIFALVRTAVFTVIVPGVVAGYLPLRVIGRDGASPQGWSYIGVVPATIGLLIYAWTAFDFAWVGRGTPAPIDPPRRLVVRGLYRYVRNPMYVGVLLVIVGEAVMRRSWQTAEYALAVAVMFGALVILLEEPLLRSQLGPPIRTTVLRFLVGCRGVRHRLNEDPSQISLYERIFFPRGLASMTSVRAIT